MTGAVKNEEVAGDGFGGNDIGILLHVSCPVDLALMVDPLSNADFALGASKTANLYENRKSIDDGSS